MWVGKSPHVISGVPATYLRTAWSVGANTSVNSVCMYARGIHPVDSPDLWLKWECEWGQMMEIHPLNTSELLAPLYKLYQTYQMRISEWRSEMYSSTRILHDPHIPAQYLEIGNRVVFA